MTAEQPHELATMVADAAALGSPYPVLVYDPATLAIVWANAAAARFYGYAPDELAARTLRDLRLPAEAPDDLGHMPRRADGWVDGGPFRHRARDGRLFEVDLHVQELACGSAALRLVTVRDMTEVVRAERREQFLSDVTRVLAGSLDYQVTLSSIARLAIAHLADGCAVHLADDDGAPRLFVAASRDPAHADLLREVERRFPAAQATAVGAAAVLRCGRARLYRVLDDDALPPPVPDEAATLALWRRMGICSAACVPLCTPTGVLGVISLASLTAGRYFDDADVAMAEELARHAALAIENARLYDAERAARRTAERWAQRNARLMTIAAALTGPRTAAEVVDVVLDEGLAALGAHAGAVAMLADEGATVEVIGAVGYPADVVERYRRLPFDAPFPLADSLRQGHAIWLATTEERDAAYPHLSGVRRANGDGPMAAIPLVVEGRAVGALGVNLSEGTTFDADDRAFILTLAYTCAQALDRARLYEAERRARAAIEAARLEAEAANRTKTEFLAVMSHELRTPLNAIAGYVELLELGLRGPVTEEQRIDLARVRRNQRHLLGLINDVLNFAKLETGSVRYEIADVDLAEVLDEVEPLVAPQLRQRALHYAVELAEPTLVARVDRDKLQQILLNLLANAIKFTEPGGTVRVTGAAEGPQLFVQVHDTGCGIPLDRQASIFEPFVQLDQRLTRTTEGTGLGLAISRDLARAMGGELTVESEPGRGSTFTVTLPRGG